MTEPKKDYEVGKKYTFGIQGIEGYFEATVVVVNAYAVKFDRGFQYHNTSSSLFTYGFDRGNYTNWFKFNNLYDVAEVAE